MGRYAVDETSAEKVEERMLKTSIMGAHEITKISSSFSRVDWFVRVWPGGIHESSRIMRRATPVPQSRLGGQKECKGMPLISFEWESRGVTCKKKIRNQGGQCPWAVVPNPAEDTLKNHRASIQSVKIVKLTRKTIQRTHLLSALLLGEHLFFLCDNLRLVFQTECEGKANQQRGRRHDPNNVSEDFSTLLDERRGRGDF